MSDPYYLQERLSFIGIDGETRTALRDFAPVIQGVLPGILDTFYQHVRQWPQLASLFAGNAAMDRAKAAQLKHWSNLFSANFDELYVRSIREIGLTHSRIGLEPRWYMGAYAFVLNQLYPVATSAYVSRFGAAGARERTGKLMRALNQAVMLDMELAISIYLEENKAAYDRKLDKLAGDFESSIGKIVAAVSAAATSVNQSSEGLTAAARATAEQTTVVAAATEEASTCVESVASAAEELTASISEIARQVAESSRSAQMAVEDAERTNAAVDALAQSAQRIGEVVSLISHIASQTNLLALNATIEAARAGTAGAGFAVVASEVKTLARQTASATEGIGQQISAIQAATGQTVAAIGKITGSIRTMSEIAASISAAVEQQTAATGEIAANVQNAATGTSAASSSLVTVQQATSETGAMAEGLHARAVGLAAESERLRSEVHAFVENIKAA